MIPKCSIQLAINGNNIYDGSLYIKLIKYLDISTHPKHELFVELFIVFLLTFVFPTDDSSREIPPKTCMSSYVATEIATHYGFSMWLLQM